MTVGELKPSGIIQNTDDVQPTVNGVKPSPSNNTHFLESKYVQTKYPDGSIGGARKPFTPQDLIEAIGDDYKIIGTNDMGRNVKLLMKETAFNNLKSDWAPYLERITQKAYIYDFQNGFTGGIYSSSTTHELSLQIVNQSTRVFYKFRIYFH